MINLNETLHGVSYHHIAALVFGSVEEVRQPDLAAALTRSKSHLLAGRWRLTKWQICKKESPQPGDIAPLLAPLEPQPWDIKGDMLLRRTPSGLRGALIMSYQPAPAAASRADNAGKAVPFVGLYEVIGAADLNIKREYDLNTVMARRINRDRNHALVSGVEHVLVPGVDHMPTGTFSLRVDPAQNTLTLAGTFVNTNSLTPGRGELMTRVGFEHKGGVASAFGL